MNRTVLAALGSALITAAALALTPTGRAVAAQAAKITSVVFTDGSGNEVGNTVQLAPGATVAASPAAGATFPVSGNVSVSNASLNVSGSVAVDGSQSVPQGLTFGGTAKNAIVTLNANDGRRPFFTDIQLTQTSCTNCAAVVQHLSLGGKVLVVEYLSGQMFGDHDLSQFEFALYSPDTGDKVADVFLLPSAGLGPSHVSTVNQSLRLYVADGGLVQVIAAMGSNGSIGGRVTIHGYLIDP